VPRDVPRKVGFLRYKAVGPRDKIQGTPYSTMRSLSITFKVNSVLAIKMYGGEEVHLHPFSVSALDTDERSAPFFNRFNSGKINSGSP
jgi:hypothetical protein